MATEPTNVQPAAVPEKTFRIQPLYDRILVQRHPEAETLDKAGLIVKADTYKGLEKRRFGTVLEVGEGRVFENGRVQQLRVHKGDTVLFGDYAGKELDKEFGPDLVMMREEEVEAIITESE